jgi:PAS domain S-box-containing protein
MFDSCTDANEELEAIKKNAPSLSNAINFPHSPENELENFFNISLELLCIVNMDGYFLKMSKEWENVLGYPIDSIISKSLYDFIHPDDIEATCLELQSLKENNPVPYFVNRYRTINGEYRFLEWNSVTAGDRIYAAARDITNRIQLQQSLEQSIKKEKELNVLMSRVVSMASHEFRTPLTSILMSTENLRSYWTRMNLHQIDTKLANIHSQISHLTAIVNNVLQISRIREGKLSPQPGRVDLVELCQSVISTFTTDSELIKKIEFNCNASNVVIAADEIMIRQVLVNLISNAVKYAQPSPEIHIHLNIDNSNAMLSIQDNGIGIPENEQNDVFQPFFRASNTRGIDGNGLGLNIVKETVELHNGTIQFESKLNKGTTFSIQLPVMQPMINE